ncbi:MAG: cobyrinate a,c-diamide synthase [Rhodospirillales bacterium]|nr:cobyrinate a,c-diamide synthase [Rhodospirillales bacterium]MDH3791262.1 cobyrinate a,c-diamide synthase [Rhodospirillales bacterium]MDH3917308.1 cobyrinate a,c-diamide synthase [Rhodospirillales bacterium]MDH3966519.1 cobyrinate a,c-diamide synthase [Rhodospirillales bacterium]
MAHLLISAAHKSSGKTSISVGIAAALSRRGLSVQPFKKGPDYIDPLWLGRAAGRPCRNLDFYTMGKREILELFGRHAAGADFSLIEGNKGLYDGVDVAGADSNAALARLLDAPVLLVIDARGMTRGVAPLIRGYQDFDPAVSIKGVILNKVGGPRHEGKLRASIERYTDVPVLGAVRRDPEIEIRERHLGLVPANEESGAEAKIAHLAETVAEQVDLDRIVALAAEASPPAAPTVPFATPRAADLRIGVARDAAFGFYYPDDLEAFAASGAQLVPFDTLHDQCLPDVDGLFIGGGFPEVHIAALSANHSLRASIKAAIEGGLPAYAECGGLMYLARSLTWRGESQEMVGVIPGDAVMNEHPVGRGYVQFEETGQGSWLLDPDAGVGTPARLSAHEFHYASLENLPGDLAYAYRMLRGAGVDGQNDGIVIGNLTASFMHLRDVRSTPWVGRFVAFVRTKTAPDPSG